MYVCASCLKLQLAVGQAKVTRLSPDTPFIEIYLFNYSFYSGVKTNLALYVITPQYTLKTVSVMNFKHECNEFQWVIMWVPAILF